MPHDPLERETNGPVEVAPDLDRAFAAMQTGDAAAFATWLQLAEIPLRASLRSFARGLDVEAVMQEGLLRMWVLAPTLALRGQNASLRYALRLLRNLALDEARRRKRFTPLDEAALERLPEPSAEPASPPDPALRRRILDCIAALPPQPRAALEARIEDNGRRPDRDLAAALRMQKNTFLQNIVRARRLVAECLQRAGVSLAEVLP